MNEIFEFETPNPNVYNSKEQFYKFETPKGENKNENKNKNENENIYKSSINSFKSTIDESDFIIKPENNLAQTSINLKSDFEKCLEEEKNKKEQKTYLETLLENKNLAKTYFNLEELLKDIDVNNSIRIADIQNQNKYLQTRIIEGINKDDFKRYLTLNYSKSQLTKISQIINDKMNGINFSEERVLDNNEALGSFESLGTFINYTFRNIDGAIEIKKKKFLQ